LLKVRRGHHDKEAFKNLRENSVISAYHFAPRLIVAVARRFFEKAVREKYELFASDVTLAKLETHGNSYNYSTLSPNITRTNAQTINAR